MKIKNKQQLPKWFRGELYEEGATVRNRFSGEEYELNNVELSMYDFIIGSTMVLEMTGGYKHTDVDELIFDTLSKVCTKVLLKRFEL